MATGRIVLTGMVATALVFSTVAAEASPITIDFIGMISKYSVANSAGFFTNALSSLGGDFAVSGSVTLDMAAGPAPTADSTPSAFVQDGYTPAEFISSTLTYALGTHTVTPVAGQTIFDRIGILDRAVADTLAVQDLATNYDAGAPLAPNIWSTLNLNFVGTDLVSPGTTGAGASFIPDLSHLGSTNSQFSTVTWANNFATGYDALFTITAATVRPVTEPGEWPLLLIGAGLLGLAVVRHRRAGPAS